jgi:hypothetical protein
MGSRWDDAADATLRRRWLPGDSAGEIASELGCSRNAIIGRANRLGLARHQARPSATWVQRRHLGVLADD